MKKILFAITILCSSTANAQNYQISFAGTGASNTVGSVKVDNLMKGTTLNLNGNDVLRLTSATGINIIGVNKLSGITIYPNPMSETSLMVVNPPVSGDAVISVFDITGKQLIQSNCFLTNSKQEFRLSGFENGLFIISILGPTYNISTKLLANSQSGNSIAIEQVTNSNEVPEIKTSVIDSKGTKVTVDMPYTAGDKLKFTGNSGDYITILTDTPTGDKTITFNFTACTDCDGNKYAVIEYGGKIWMAENLKTTKYSDNSAIPLVTDASWATLTTPAYCWYNNNEATYKNVYGGLYNWYTISPATNGGKNVCPSGWHVPQSTDWSGMIYALGGTNVAGGKLKEKGTTHWYGTNSGVTNEIGFTALPGGGHFFDGSFDAVRMNGYWWTADGDPLSKAYSWAITYGQNWINSVENKNTNGFSIRCIKDN